ncbi:hypothetical protein K491DRAFT_699571 [Lophiostoma macrostomum CBS 122681]|uniref:Uncharacterized protein n=1 Tax=Lophiostoma macrostomum CBS 122681 TaxID=1314788 RepID=A0A6A6SID1_9PLEO|nr:hypothetical protein K491DRAFT_699571 [Lophiostoma macrostomum CBS 122681]
MDLRSAYSIACMHGHTDLVRYFLENNKVHVNVFESPLRTAIEHGHCGVARVLLEYGADINDPYLLPIALQGDKNTKFLLVEFLLANGYIVAESHLRVFINALLFPSHKLLSVDENMALVLVGHTVKQRNGLKRAEVPYQMVDRLRAIKEGICQVPTEPMPFRQLAHEIFDWLHSLPN